MIYGRVLRAIYDCRAVAAKVMQLLHHYQTVMEYITCY
jgi:hypothetical protein